MFEFHPAPHNDIHMEVLKTSSASSPKERIPSGGGIMVVALPAHLHMLLVPYYVLVIYFVCFIVQLKSKKIIYKIEWVSIK